MGARGEGAGISVPSPAGMVPDVAAVTSSATLRCEGRPIAVRDASWRPVMHIGMSRQGAAVELERVKQPPSGPLFHLSGVIDHGDVAVLVDDEARRPFDLQALDLGGPR